MDGVQIAVFIVPGYLGTQLSDGGILPVWPDKALKDVASCKAIADEVTDPNLTPFIASVFYYDQLSTQIATAAGTDGPVAYTVGSGFALPKSGNAVFGVAYDWRMDVADQAKLFANDIQTATKDLSGDWDFWFVGHSMGGLLSRYMFEAGLVDKTTLDASLVTLGTPHGGAALAFKAIANGITQADFFGTTVKFQKDDVVNIVSKPGQPAAYELLPPTGVDFIVGADQSDTAVFSAFDSDVMQVIESDYSGCEGSFGSASAFSEKLKDPRSFWGDDLYLIYGTMSEQDTDPNTLDSYQYTTDSDGDINGFQDPPTGAPAYVDGDTVVSRGSAFPAGDNDLGGSYQAPGVNHMDLPKDPGVIDQVIKWVFPS